MPSTTSQELEPEVDLLLPVDLDPVDVVHALRPSEHVAEDPSAERLDEEHVAPRRLRLAQVEAHLPGVGSPLDQLVDRDAVEPERAGDVVRGSEWQKGYEDV